MTRRKLFQILACLPVVGRLVAKPEPMDWYTASIPLPKDALVGFVGPVTHRVGTGWGLSYPQYPTIAEALKHVVEGRGDRIVIAAGHSEPWVPDEKRLVLPRGTTVISSRS